MPKGSWARESGHGEQNLVTRFVRVSAVMFVDGRCVSNWKCSKLSDAAARGKRERLIPIVSLLMHHKCDEEFLITYIGCVLSITRQASHAGLNA